MENRAERASRNLIWTGISKAVNILLPFVTQTCLIYVLGVRYVGLDGLFTSVLQVLNLTELGIGSALVFSMYKPVAEGDDQKVCALLSLYKKCYRLIGCIVLAVGLCVLPFIEKFISGEIPEDVNIYFLYIVYLSNTVLSYFLFAYKSSLLNACQRVDTLSLIDTAATCVKALLQCAALLLLPDYFLFVCILPVVTILRNLFTSYLVNKKYPQYVCRGRVGHEDIALIKEKVAGLIFQKAGSVVLFAVDNIVISAFLGLTVLGLYNNYLYVHKALVSLVGVIITAIIPVVGNSIVVESREKNYKNFKQFTLLYMWVVSWCSISLLCLHQPFMRLWVGEERLLDQSVMVLFVIYFYMNKIGDMTYAYKEAAGIWWEGRYVTLVSSLLNLSLNLLLVRVIGLKGILLSTIVSLALVNIPFGGRVLFSAYFEYPHAWKRYLQTHTFHLAVTVAAGGITYGICRYLPDGGFLALLSRGVVCLILPNLILLAAYIKHPDLRGAGKFLKRIWKKD